MMRLFILSILIGVRSIVGASIAVVGCGYVGLATTAFFLRAGHTVYCVDVDLQRIELLCAGELPIFEAELAAVLFDSQSAKRLHFTTDQAEVSEAEIFYICVPTPTTAQGRTDCTALHAAFDKLLDLCRQQQSKKVICVKSTLPPGTVATLQKKVDDLGIDTVAVVYNPEFMREGSALKDMNINPVVLAGTQEWAVAAVQQLYCALSKAIIKTTFETAELIKYSWNAFGALRVSFINELATICRRYNADIATIAQSLEYSQLLLPTSALRPGPGFGGSCFPKDVQSFAQLFRAHGINAILIDHILRSNEQHKQRLIYAVMSQLSAREGSKTVAILGLAFKAGTNDIRNAPSIDLIDALLAREIRVKAYDPQAIANMQQLYKQVEYYEDPYEAVEGADCIVILTEWTEIKNLNLSKVARQCRGNMVIDTRNLFSQQELQEHGFACIQTV